MNLREGVAPLREAAFRTYRTIASLLPGGRIASFGPDGISRILVINLDRQPTRWRRLMRELGRFKIASGAPLPTIVQRLAAVDARDGRSVAATADVDTVYTTGDQLFVQPDARLEDCFGVDHPVRMTRQEVAVARSHVEAWKIIASGDDLHVLVLEDDVWLRCNAAKSIDRGWAQAVERQGNGTGPHLLYLSYKDAGGTADRDDSCANLFRPRRGLWFLSGYVLSREGAARLLRAMPVVGPVDLWMNYRLGELDALALTRPAILQAGGHSDNAYSILPLLARSGTIDGGSPPVRPTAVPAGLSLAWTTRRSGALAMALSMLGLRVRAFSGDEDEMTSSEIAALFKEFDALVNPPVGNEALTGVIRSAQSVFVVEAGDLGPRGPQTSRLPPARTAEIDPALPDWTPVCNLLGLSRPVDPYPCGTATGDLPFRVGRSGRRMAPSPEAEARMLPMDDSPWILPPSADWRPSIPMAKRSRVLDGPDGNARRLEPQEIDILMETFPGNLARFDRDAVVDISTGRRLILSEARAGGVRPFLSGAFASRRQFGYGRFEASIKAASGSGLVTGFFLHRNEPRQEIDIEMTGRDATSMLVNVYFNPGDPGAAMGFGYRGSPCRIELGFDATADFHDYGIEWSPDRICWTVDGRIVHERGGWDPTPIPHLPMRLHCNLWAPRSAELAGRLDRRSLPASAEFRKLTVVAPSEEPTT